MYNPQNTTYRIKQIAKERGMSVTDLLAKCSLGRNVLSQSAKSQEGMKAKNLYAIAEILNCSVDYLLGRTDNPNINGNNISAGNTGIGVGNFNSSINITAKDKKFNEFDSTTMQVAEAFQNLDFDDKFEVMQLLIQKKKSK